MSARLMLGQGATQLAVRMARVPAKSAGAFQRGETFRVDLLFYSLIVLAILAICLVIARIPGRARLSARPMDLAERAREHREQQRDRASLGERPRRKAVLRRELKKVPTPWGWPGSDARHGADSRHAGDRLRDWIDHLVAQKRTVEDNDYRLHQSEALRSMIEDRFGHAARPAEMQYRKVKPPRLADPARPHDQMDNFPSGKTDAIVGKLSRHSRKSKVISRANPVRKAAGVENIKKPWGW